ncbi:DUF6225 family protein [Nocardia sp. NPDC049149]|uniref:DUF6225 family protein n=1 Tax=Nocardia sp. NPDC049149 TaxID=3364315 RepID=UPI003710F826
MPDQPSLTVRQLREALANYPDDLPVVVCVAEDEDSFLEFLITNGPSHGHVDWGDGKGVIVDKSHVQIEAFEYYRPTRPE